jgi:hypothetical protein
MMAGKDNCVSAIVEEEPEEPVVETPVEAPAAEPEKTPEVAETPVEPEPAPAPKETKKSGGWMNFKRGITKMIDALTGDED